MIYLRFFQVLGLLTCLLFKVAYCENISFNPDNIVNNNCELRFKIIKQILDKYKRSFTILDIGALQGDYSFKIASKYNCICVMIEQNSNLLDLCKAAGRAPNAKLNNIILLQKAICIPDLIRLSECEHFDVILALNIIETFKDKWKDAIKPILAMGNNIIIEVPELSSEINKYLNNKHAKVLGRVANSTIYLIESNANQIQRKTWVWKKLNNGCYKIKSDFKEKFLVKNVDINGNLGSCPVLIRWVPGINLITFKMYNGVYPLTSSLKKSLTNCIDRNHKDWIINNMILQGNRIQLIDGTYGNTKYSDKLYKAHCNLLDIDDPREVENFFWSVLTKV